MENNSGTKKLELRKETLRTDARENSSGNGNYTKPLTACICYPGD